ncbi:MFS transporter [Streptomyces cinereospinus]|uniref:MFS transporter n=1 Tax=Streptomyces cinereospinus TaxID=285561 RepID=A0ABV5N8R4_9ACTN
MKGITPNQAAVLVTLFGVTSLLGRALGGLLLDRVHAPVTCALVIVCPVAGVFLLHAPFAGAAVGTALIGIAFGVEIDLLPFLVSRYLGMRHFGTLLGILHAAITTTSAFGPPVISLGYDRLGSYDTLMFYVAGVLILCALLALRLGPYRYPAVTGFDDVAAQDEPTGAARLAGPVGTHGRTSASGARGVLVTSRPLPEFRGLPTAAGSIGPLSSSGAHGTVPSVPAHFPTGAWLGTVPSSGPPFAAHRAIRRSRRPAPMRGSGLARSPRPMVGRRRGGSAGTTPAPRARDQVTARVQDPSGRLPALGACRSSVLPAGGPTGPDADASPQRALGRLTALGVLAGEQPVPATVSGVARRLGLSVSAASRMLAHLVRSGWTDKVAWPCDRRAAVTDGRPRRMETRR